MANRRRTPHFLRNLFTLEERAVPASYYVDNTFTQPVGSTVTFNAGQPNQVSGLVIGTDAFLDFGDAIDKANGDAAADSIFFASQEFAVDQGARGGAYLITNPLSFVGSGQGVTTLKSVSDTIDSSGTNGALFAAQNTIFNVNNLSLNGQGNSGFLTASGFRYEGSTGTINLVDIQNVSDLSSPLVSLGYGVVITNAGSNVTVSNSSFGNNGRGAIRLDAAAQATVTGNTLVGRPVVAGNFPVSFGVDITNGSKALISGNTLTGFVGNDVATGSAAVQVVSEVVGSPSTATLLGNTFDGNDTGIIVGIDGTDGSSVIAQFNNILNNNAAPGQGSGISVNSTATSDARNNWWGSQAGPLAPDNPGGTASSSVTAGVTYKDAAILQPPQGIAQALLPVVVSDTPANARIAASPMVAITGSPSGTNSPITLTFIFTQAVTGFDQTDVVLGGTAGPATITAFNTTDNITFTATVSGLTMPGTVSASVAANVATAATGLGNIANSASIPFAPASAAPSVTITGPPAGTNSPITLTVTFSSTVADFTASDVILGGTAGMGVVTSVSPAGNGSVFSVVVSGLTSTGNLTVSIPANSVTDATTGVGNTAGNATIPFATSTAPTVTITGPAAGTNSPFGVTIIFSEAVNGFVPSDIVLSGNTGPATVTNLTTTDNTTFTALVSGSNQRGTLTVTVPAASATNAGGVGNIAGSANINFQPAFDRGFAVSGDSGATTPVFGVTDQYTTRFGKAVFGANFTGGQRVATADLNGDGTLDYIVGSGPGIPTQVLAFDGISGKQIFSITPFGTSFTRGAYVAGGDLTGDGRAEIVITAERGGGARVRIFSPDAVGGFNQTSDFIGIIGANGVADTAFRGGARAAVGDINGDGRNDLIFAAGTGGGPRIAIFNGLTLGTNGGPKLTGDFFVFESTLRDGSYVASGDVDGDGKADLIVGAGNGASRVRVINGNTLFTSKGTTVTALSDFFAYGSKGSTGVRVAADDLDGDGKTDVITGPGSNAGSTVQTYSAVNLLANPGTPAITRSLNLFGSFNGGLFVG